MSTPPTPRRHRVLRNIGWSAVSELMDKAFRFLSLPLLLAGYGRENYALIAIVFAIRGYLALLALGTPAGMVRFVARWLQKGDTRTIEKCCRTNLTLYGIIGVLNAVVFASLAWWGVELFRIQPAQAEILRNMLLITAAYVLIFWPGQMLGHLLTAAEEIHYVQKCSVLRSALEFTWVLAAVHWQVRIDTYFAVRLMISLVVLPLFAWRWSRHVSLRATLRPGWAWQEFRPVILYGLGMFAISWSHSSFVELRPVLLGITGASVGAVTDFAVMAAIVGLFKMAGSWIAGPLIPAASRAIAGDNQARIDFVVYRGAKYFWLVLAFPATLVLLNGSPLLSLYAGKEFESLGPWLGFMTLSAVEAYLAPFAGIIFAVGKLRPYIWWNAVLSAIGLGIVWFGAPSLGARAAVIATCFYSLAQFLYHQFHYFPHVMGWNSRRIFSETFLKPLTAAALTAAAMLALRILWPMHASWWRLAVEGILSALAYAAVAWSLVLDAGERSALRQAIIQRLKGAPIGPVPQPSSGSGLPR